MWNKSDKIIELVELKYKGDGEVENGCIELTWDEIVEMFSTHDVRDKKDGLCFMPVQMKERDQWVLTEPRFNHEPTFRNEANVKSITMVVIDLDLKDSLPKAEDLFKDFEYFVYSTHSYTAETPYKFRMVLALNEPVLAENWPDTFKKITMGIDADKSCGNLSRVFFYPSISVDAGIAPFFKHNKGRELNKEDIDELERKFESSLSPEERQQIKSRLASIALKNNRRHFSGDSSENELRKYKDIDYTYEGMKKRHEKNINELKSSDGRHNFALKTIAKEISTFKDKTDVFCLVLFIHRAAYEFSSKSINSGNTNQEIPEMICSAMLKYAPETELDRRQINEVVEMAARSADNGISTRNWEFQEDSKDAKAGGFDKSLLINHGNNGYSYNEIRGRNLNLMRGLINSGNVNEFAVDIFNKEIERSGEKADLNAIGQFVVFCYKNYLDKCAKVENPVAVINEQHRSIIESVCNDLSKIPHAADFTKFIKTSLLIARKSSEENNWNFPKELNQQSSLSR